MGSVALNTSTEPLPAAGPAPQEREGPAGIVGGAIGLLSAAVALGVGHLTAGLAGGTSSPVIAVGSTAIDASPEWLKSYAIRTFGTNDKAVLVAGIGLVVAILAIVVGVIALRRARVGVVALVALGTLGAAAAIGRPENGIGAAVPSILATVAGLGTFSRLRRAAGLATPVSGAGEAGARLPPSFDRRRFLFAGAGAAGLAAVFGLAGRFLMRRAEASASRAAVRIPAPADVAPLPPAGADLHIPDVGPFITPNDRFYRVDTALLVPSVTAEGWTLRVHGMVRKELSLDYSTLLSRPLIERDVTLTCVSNPVGGRYIGDARWIGAPLADLLREAGVSPGADQIVSRSVDGFTVGTPTAVVMDGRDAMLAVAMNGEPLPLEHGFPVRMIVPDEVARRHRAHDLRRLRRLLGPPRLGAAGADQDRVPDRHAETVLDRRRRTCHGRGDRVGAASGDLTRGGERGRRVATRSPGRPGHDRYLAAMGLRMGRDAGRSHPRRASHRRHRGDADRDPGRSGAERRDRRPHHLGDRRRLMVAPPAAPGAHASSANSWRYAPRYWGAR